MTRHGQIQVYGGHAPKEEFDIINNKDYNLKIKKTWIEATNVWHIQLISQSIFDRRFECFLTHEELAKFKDAL
tara:strand:- start:959 stop:1177 length:219 start_codon:yes stop_codon:yes gene_type:complete